MKLLGCSSSTYVVSGLQSVLGSGFVAELHGVPRHKGRQGPRPKSSGWARGLQACPSLLFQSPLGHYSPNLCSFPHILVDPCLWRAGLFAVGRVGCPHFGDGPCRTGTPASRRHCLWELSWKDFSSWPFATTTAKKKKKRSGFLMNAGIVKLEQYNPRTFKSPLNGFV